MDNSRILIISDQHAPYHHPDTIAFLTAIKERYAPTRIINIGDEVDFHAMSYHDSNPNLPSAGEELREANKFISKLHKLFPKMDLMESNHGSMKFRKALSHGIPVELLASNHIVLGVGEGWIWHPSLILTLPDGSDCLFRHQYAANVLNASKDCGMSFVQGHYHSKFVIDYWGNSQALNFGMTVGCLIDDDSLAFAYNKTTPKRPMIGVGMIIDSQPILIPMRLKKGGRWNKKLPDLG